MTGRASELVGLAWAADFMVTTGPAAGEKVGDLATLGRPGRILLCQLAERAATFAELAAARIVLFQLPTLDEDLLEVARSAGGRR